MSTPTIRAVRLPPGIYALPRPSLQEFTIPRLFDALGVSEPWAQSGLALAAVGALSAFSYFIAKQILLRGLRAMLGREAPAHEHQAFLRVVRRLANLLPAGVVLAGIGLVPHLPTGAVTVVRNVATGMMILIAAVAIGAALDWLAHLYSRRPGSAMRPVKSYVQVLKIGLYCVAAILMIAALIDRSPVLLFSGLGAMAAVLMLVFKDTILSLVASVQLTSNDMIRVGDWVEMPDFGADGDVIDIALHTVKIQNFDKTITTVPTHRLISEPFRNWRGMLESGGRRIKRSLYLDQNSVRLLSPDDIERLERIALLRGYLARKRDELRRWNGATAERGTHRANARRLTNVGTFRAYVSAYLEAREDISAELFLLVRQLAPSEVGLPLEIYCFADTTDWGRYENIQGDIFDHLIAVLPEFGLRLFQRPSGLDFASEPRAAAQSWS